ncbi:MAG: hypothetical protein D6689_15050 [Deltaproteobacteria bacterium]|nr:MAG: hypothetical protein D6689_15050 [Deltaproteobacteria bacterium]
MSARESVEVFCSECGSRVVLRFRRGDIGVDVAGCEPCRVTEGGTVYCECPGCGETVAAHPPYTPAARAALG